MRNDSSPSSTRKAAVAFAVIVMAACAVALTVNAGPESLSTKQSEDSHANVVPKVRATKLDEAYDKINAQAVIAAFTPFLNTKDAGEMAEVKKFNADAKFGDVKKYQEDIEVLLKGIDDERKQLSTDTKGEPGPHGDVHTD